MPLNSVPPILWRFWLRSSLRRVFGQLLEPLMGEPEALVALLIDENLPRARQSPHLTEHRQPGSGWAHSTGRQGSAGIVAALDSQVPLQRLNAAYVLTLIDTPAAQSGALRAARNEDQAVKALAIEAPCPCTPAVKRPTGLGRLVRSHSGSSDGRDDGLYAAAEGQTVDHPARYIAAQKIAELLKVAELRPTAAWVLGHLGSDVAARQLVAALDDARPEVRSEILASLAKLGDKQTTSASCRVARRRGQLALCRGYDAGGTARFAGDTALTAALADSAASVRREAAAALGKTGDWLAGERLWPLLDDADDDVSRNAGGWARSVIGRQSPCSSRFCRSQKFVPNPRPTP